MQTIFRLKAQKISMSFLKSLKTMFADQEVEIIVKSVDSSDLSNSQKGLLEMIRDNRKQAPIISQNLDIRGLIDESQYPAQ